MSQYVTVGDKSYRVVERLGYQGGHNKAIIVSDETGRERTAVFAAGAWRFWTAEDRLGAPRVQP